MPHHHHLLLPRRLLVTPFVSPSLHNSPSLHSSPSLIHEGIFYSFAAVFLAVVVYYVFDYLIVRFFHLSRQQSQPPPDCRDNEREDVLLIELQTIPLKVYHASPPDGGDDGMQDENCPVCLGEYVDGEELRVLPICRHAFHRECIDKWLLFKSSSFSSLSFSSSSTSCPVCRGSILDPEMAAAAVAAEEPAVEVAAEEETNVSV